MDIHNKINKLKKECNLFLIKNIFIFSVGNIIVLSGLKLSNLGFPFVIDKEKHYKYTITTINNYNDIKKIERYINYKEVNNYNKKDNLLYIKDNYKYQNNYDNRDVRVYKITTNDNYKDVLSNYQDYIKSDNLIDYYTEKTNYLDSDQLKEIIVKYHNINKNNFIIKKESINNNMISTSIYTMLFIVQGIPYISYIIHETKDKDREIKRLIKRKEK
ncbi:MAG: hypothetical protein IKF19_05965 [Bacilli bacterium]|nr:hypothetical protein [Bacilli bacterium]